MIRLYSWNVNGIRAAQGKGLLDWMRASSPMCCACRRPKRIPTSWTRMRVPAGYQLLGVVDRQKGLQRRGDLYQNRAARRPDRPGDRGLRRGRAHHPGRISGILC